MTSATAPGRPVRRRMRRADRGRQLLEVAERVFAERGFRAASMDDVADAAGVTKPVLYDHFGSKDGLLAALVAASHAELRGAVTEAVAEAADGEDALARGLRAYFAFIRAHADAWAVLLDESEASSAAGEAVEAMRTEMADFIAAQMSADLPAGAADRAAVYAQVVVGASERLAHVTRGDRSATPARLTEALMDMVWVGLAALRAGQRWTGDPGYLGGS